MVVVEYLRSAGILERMKNDPLKEPPGQWDFFWEWDVVNGLVYAPLLAIAGLLIGLKDPGMLSMLGIFWLGYYVIFTPLLIWGILMRHEPGRPWVALAALLIGAAPSILFLPGGPLYEMPAILFGFPVLVIWGVGGQVFALNDRKLPPRPRAILMGMGALGCCGIFLMGLLFLRLGLREISRGGPYWIATGALVVGLSGFGVYALTRGAIEVYRSRHDRAATRSSLTG